MEKLMRCRGTTVLFIVFSLLFASVLTTAAPPAHKNFSEADEDLFAVLSFLGDAKRLCEDTFVTSYMANCTVLFNDLVKVSYDADQLNISKKNADRIQQKLHYSSEVLEHIRETAGSYRYLKDFLLPIQRIGNNISSLVYTHSFLITSFQDLAEFTTNVSVNTMTIFNEIIIIQQSLANFQNIIDQVELLLPEISPYFSTETFEQYIPKYYELITRYDSYLTLFLNFFPSMSPQLILLIDQTDVILGDSIQVSGFFVTENGFIPNQLITIQIDGKTVNTTSTTGVGRYQCQIETNYFDEPTMHVLASSTVYNNTLYTSENITVMYHKIPTNLLLSLPQKHFDPDEPIVFSGSLTTYKNQGLQGTIFLHYGDKNQSLQTDELGEFSYTVSENISLGSYTAWAEFTPNAIYEPCTSNMITFSVDIPTSLTASVESQNLSVGESLIVYGRLQEESSSMFLPEKTIQVIIDGVFVGSATTNQTGWYRFSWDTSDKTSGMYTIYTKYVPDDPYWRSCTSPTVTFVISAGLLEKLMHRANMFLETFPVDILVFSCLLIVFLLVLFLLLWQRKKRSSQPVSSDFINDYHSSFFHFTRGWRKFSPSQLEKQYDSVSPSSLKQKIVARYRLLLRYLSSRGIRFPSTYTHRDIQKQLQLKGMPKKVIDEVTDVFEHARYSLHPSTEEDVALFDSHVFSLVTEFEE